MIKKWQEYITENVDPESFDSVIYMRSDHSNTQFWFYLKLGYTPNDEQIFQHIIEDFLPTKFNGFYVEDDYLYNLSIASYFNISRLSVHGLSYDESYTEELINHFKGISKSTLLTWKSYQLIQIQLVNVEPKGYGIDFDVIDYYI